MRSSHSLSRLTKSGSRRRRPSISTTCWSTWWRSSKTTRTSRAELDRRFRYVLVDEYQDTNLAQYAIVRALSVDHPNLCVTGDPDQSIYGWRGANLSNILEFEQDFPGCRVVTLERNYRSTKNIISVADHLIRFNRNRKPKALLTENPIGEPVELTIYRTRDRRGRGGRREIAGLVREGEYGFADIAVFCRVTALTRPFEQAFRSARIPYQVVGRRRVLRTPGGQGRPRLSELDGQSQGRPRLRCGWSTFRRGLGKTSLEHSAAAARAAGDSAAGDGAAGRHRCAGSRTRPAGRSKTSPG